MGRHASVSLYPVRLNGERHRLLGCSSLIPKYRATLCTMIQLGSPLSLAHVSKAWLLQAQASLPSCASLSRGIAPECRPSASLAHTDCFRAAERATVLGWEETMPDAALDDLMETLSIELGERLQAATGKRLHFALIAADHLEARVMATNSSASAVKVLAEMLRVMADDLGRRH